MGRKSFNSYRHESDFVRLGLATMEGGLFSLLSLDADFNNIVHLTKLKKTEWMTLLGSKSKYPARDCNTYIARLITKGLIRRKARSVLMLNPLYRDKINDGGSHARLMRDWQQCGVVDTSNIYNIDAASKKRIVAAV